jgi:Flp pilus assembly protein TadB
MTCLILVTTLGDELVADLDPGLQDVLVQLVSVEAKEGGSVAAILKQTISPISERRKKIKNFK